MKLFTNMKCNVTEKTLELNLMENIINYVRHRGHPNAYIEGYSSRVEATNGLDSSIAIPPNTHIVSMQFKKPLRRKNHLFEFEINIKYQHLKLLIHALSIEYNLHKNHHCYYIFSMPLQQT